MHFFILINVSEIHMIENNINVKKRKFATSFLIEMLSIVFFQKCDSVIGTLNHLFHLLGALMFGS